MEVIVALAIGAMVILGARAMLDALGDAAQRSQRTLDHAGQGAAERTLRELALNLELRGDSLPSVETGDGAVAFGSWCGAPGAAMERCVVRLRVRADADTGVSVEPTVGGALLVRTAGVPQVLFLASSTYGGRWRAEWLGGQTPPLAIGMATARDTLVLPVGLWR